MRSENVTFKTVDAPVETPAGEEKRTMDVIEIAYPDGKVVAFPVDDVSPETGVKYRDMFPAKFAAFKSGDPDPDRVEQLEREIEEREAELKALRPGRKDDARIQENLGYGKVPDPNSERVAAQHRQADRRAPKPSKKANA